MPSLRLQLLPLHEFIEQSVWVRSLCPSERALVHESCTERCVAAREAVAALGDPAEHWMGVIDGVFKMQVRHRDGRCSTLTGVAHGGWFAEGTLLRHEPYRYEVVALRAGRLACLPRATFEALRARSLAFNHYLEHLLNARLGHFIGLLHSDRLLDADARVAHSLASLYNPDLYPDPGPRLNFAQSEVALLAGISRQRANAALQRLDAAGLIRLDTRGMTVLDLDGLRHWEGPFTRPDAG